MHGQKNPPFGETADLVLSYCFLIKIVHQKGFAFGAEQHQMGNLTKTVAYCAQSGSFPAISGREDLSCISMVERLFLSIQSRSLDA